MDLEAKDYTENLHEDEGGGSREVEGVQITIGLTL